MSPIRIGVIGLSATNPKSWAAAALIPQLFNPPLNADYVLNAICTSSEKSALASKAKYSEIVGHPINAYYGSGSSGASDISNDPEVDLVVVAVKTPQHKDAAMPVIEAGKDLFIEWPAGNGLQETEDIAQAARQKGVRAIVGAQTNNSLEIKKVREIIASGKLGRIISTTMVGNVPGESMVWGPKVGNPYTLDETQGASMLEIAGGHLLVGLLHALGCTTFLSVSSTATIAYPTASIIGPTGEQTGTFITTNPDQVAFSGILKETGTLASITLRGGMKNLPGRDRFTWIIDGEEGSIKLESPHAFIGVSEMVLTLNGEVIEVDAEAELPGLREKGAAGNIARSWANFAKGSGYTTIEEAVQVKKIITAVIRSAKEGKRIDL